MRYTFWTKDERNSGCVMVTRVFGDGKFGVCFEFSGESER
jgi:hypothetical protein